VPLHVVVTVPTWPVASHIATLPSALHVAVFGAQSTQPSA
jgi:hypothetical protein